MKLGTFSIEYFILGVFYNIFHRIINNRAFSSYKNLCFPILGNFKKSKFENMKSGKILVIYIYQLHKF